MYYLSSSWYLIMISIHPHSKPVLQWLVTCWSDFCKLEVILRSESTENGMYQVDPPEDQLQPSRQRVGSLVSSALEYSGRLS